MRAQKAAGTVLQDNPMPVEEQIRQRAYEIFLNRGEQRGSPEEDWYLAEAEIRQTTGNDRNFTRY